WSPFHPAGARSRITRSISRAKLRRASASCDDSSAIRRKTDCYDDFQMLPNEATGEVVFLGGKDYLPLFCNLTESVKGKRIAFYNSANMPRFSGCVFRKFETTTRTNWHYGCANALLEGKIGL